MHIFHKDRCALYTYVFNKVLWSYLHICIYYMFTYLTKSIFVHTRMWESLLFKGWLSPAERWYEYTGPLGRLSLVLLPRASPTLNRGCFWTQATLTGKTDLSQDFKFHFPVFWSIWILLKAYPFLQLCKMSLILFSIFIVIFFLFL